MTTDQTDALPELNDFIRWWNSKPHRLKYPPDHPAHLAAREAWEGAVAAARAPLLGEVERLKTLLTTEFGSGWEDWDRVEAMRLRAELAARPAVPEGWQLVPKEPTEAMKIAGDHAPFWCGDKYHAMLAASPQPPEPLEPK